MKTASIQFLRSSMEAEKFLAGICDLFLAGFPGQIVGVYLLGSRAVGTPIGTSDVDLAVVFNQASPAAKRPAVLQFVNALCRLSPVPLDIAILDEADMRKGIKPHLRIGRLLIGKDIVKECPLKPKEELLLFYMGSPIHFIRILRGNPKTLRYPLDYPKPEGIFHGYEVNGVLVGEGEYRPGFNTLLNLIIVLANARLALKTGVFTLNKSMTVDDYRKHLPADPWLGLIEEIYDLCRNRLQGRMPENEAERATLAGLCERVLPFENDYLRISIENLEIFSAIENPDLKRQVRQLINTLESDTPPQSRMLAEVKGRMASAAGGR